jgi:AraC-like DNA-binding protein
MHRARSAWCFGWGFQALRVVIWALWGRNDQELREWEGQGTVLGIVILPLKITILILVTLFGVLTSAAMALQAIVASNTTSTVGVIGETGMSLQMYQQVVRAFTAWLAEWSGAMQALGLVPVIPGATDPRVETARELLDKHWFVSSVPYKEIVGRCGVSRVHLDRLFVHDLGTTPKQYSNRRCLAEAMRLLRGTRLSVKEVTCRLGFPASAHFCRWFLRHAGVYPQSYRKGMADM